MSIFKSYTGQPLTGVGWVGRRARPHSASGHSPGDSRAALRQGEAPDDVIGEVRHLGEPAAITVVAVATTVGVSWGGIGQRRGRGLALRMRGTHNLHACTATGNAKTP